MNANPVLTISKAIFTIFIILNSFFLKAQTSANSITVASPNQANQIVVSCQKGVLTYQIIHNGVSIMNPSTLGFVLQYKSDITNKILYNNSFQIEYAHSSTFHEFWKPVWGTDSLIENSYNESIITILNNTYPDIQLKFFVRAYDDGVAFRYFLEKSTTCKNDSIFVIEELTQFHFAHNDSAWFAPAADFAYESIYKNYPLSEIKNSSTPITICRDNQLTVCIHEAALSNYSEFYLNQAEEGKPNFVSALWPEPDGVCARLQFPFQTPWRVIMIAKTPGRLIESHLILNLNKPSEIKNTEWIKPIKFVGIWWGMHTGKYTWSYGEKHGATTERTKKYIDFAAQHHIEGVLAEGWNLGWETWNSVDYPFQNFTQEYPDFNLEEVVKYGKQKNVHFVSHHETGGNIPEYEKQLDSALKLCNQLGIKYLKTGYAGKIIPYGYPHHGQYMVNHFQKVVEKAAQYQICLDVHESIKPTGLERTWPNLMSQEAIMGNEWNGGYKPTPPSHTTILPFTRYIAGPADYTPGIFNTKHTPDKGKRLFTTRAHQMALMVIFFSPMSMVSDMIENYENQREFQFMEEVPSSWDQSTVLACEIGKYVSIARKKEEKWYLGSITNQECRILTLPLHFLNTDQTYTVTIYGDGFENDWQSNPDQVEIGKYFVTANDSITIVLGHGSGNVMVFERIDKNDKRIDNVDKYNEESPQKFLLFSQKEFRELSQTIYKHKGYQCKVEYKTPYNQKYSGEGAMGLTNGKLGTYNFFEEWQGFEGTDVKLELDLGSVKLVSTVDIRFMDAINDWIFAPHSVTIWGSVDGKIYEIIEKINLTGNTEHDYNVVEFKVASFKLENKNIRYLKIESESVKICPEWHYGSGKSAWTFCDEIIVE